MILAVKNRVLFGNQACIVPRVLENINVNSESISTHCVSLTIEAQKRKWKQGNWDNWDNL